MFILKTGTVMNKEILGTLIGQHKAEMVRLQRLEDMYEGRHPILDQDAKAEFKPDNRLVANFAKYIVDTLNGFFIGIPIKISHENATIAEYVDFLDRYNSQDDQNAELSKYCSVFGSCLEMYFMDESAQVGIKYVKPTEAFVVYDDSILHRPMYSVRYYTNTDGNVEGSFADASNVYYFNAEYTIDTVNVGAHPFGGVPMVEYVENAERMGAFESVESLIIAFDRALSEKANDVDYYADAYLKVLGAVLDTESLAQLRDNRIINLSSDYDKLDVGFLDKPDSDSTQEHLIDRLEKLIFHLSMVANINDENFGDTSGVALKFKLQSMSNLAKTKERKFASGLTQRYKLIANVPVSKMGSEDWIMLNYKFTRNMPNNEKEESEVAKNLTGIVSKETQLTALSIIENVAGELERIKNESEAGADTFARTPTI